MYIHLLVLLMGWGWWGQSTQSPTLCLPLKPLRMNQPPRFRKLNEIAPRGEWAALVSSKTFIAVPLHQTGVLFVFCFTAPLNTGQPSHTALGNAVLRTSKQNAPSLLVAEYLRGTVQHQGRFYGAFFSLCTCQRCRYI